MRALVSKLDKERYGRLLAQALPRPIRTRRELRLAEEQLLQLEDREESLTREEEELFDLLAALIESYERKNFSFAHLATPSEKLKAIMEFRQIKQTELAAVIGSQGIASELLSGKRSISKAQAKKLAGFFRVGVEVFI